MSVGCGFNWPRIAALDSKPADVATQVAFWLRSGSLTDIESSRDTLMMRTFGILFLAVLSLAGCQVESELRGVSDLTRDLRHKVVRFVLTQDVSVPSGRARLFLQDGSVVGGRNFYRPHCILEIDSIDHAGFPISEETFDVIRIQRSTVQTASDDNLRFAAAFIAFGSYESNSDRFHDGYHFWLQSDAQPAVMRLTCYGVFARPSDLRPPTLEEINAALGAVGTIQVEEHDKQ
jgi:hypothetical protein